MATTLVGIFDDFSQAQTAVRALTQAGISHGEILVVRSAVSRVAFACGFVANDIDFAVADAGLR